MGIFDRWRRKPPPVPDVDPVPVTFYGGPAFRDVSMKALEVAPPQALFKIVSGHYYLCAIDLAANGRLVVLKFAGNVDDRGQPIFELVEGFGDPLGHHQVIAFSDLGTVEP